MPSISSAQQHYMAGCAHNPEKMAGECPPHEVAEEFSKKDSVIKENLTTEKDDAISTNPAPDLIAIPESMVTTELDIARQMVEGTLSSPQFFENVHLFDLRITGTGAAFRPSLKEFVYRNPENYLNSEFLQRCNGLPVVWIHPPKVLNSEEFSKRIIGTIFIPYIKNNEVWGIAKVYDDEAIKFMVQSQMSTSPGLKFSKEELSERIQMDGDNHSLLIEGIAYLLDHLAICEVGVWDKLSDPTGIRIDSATFEDRKMSEENKEVKKDSDPMEINKTILDALGKLGERLDGMDKRFDAMEEKKPEVKADEAKEKEEKEEKEKLNSERLETQRRLDAIDEKMKNDCEETNSAAMNDAQYKFDSALQLHGKQAPRPLLGEKVHAYRLRNLKALQEFSSSLKEVDLSKITDEKAFDFMETQIINDSAVAANDPARIASTLPRGQLREIKKKIGRVEVSEFVGDISAFTNSFRQPSFKGKIIKQSNNI